MAAGAAVHESRAAGIDGLGTRDRGEQDEDGHAEDDSHRRSVIEARAGKESCGGYRGVLDLADRLAVFLATAFFAVFAVLARAVFAVVFGARVLAPASR